MSLHVSAARWPAWSLLIGVGAVVALAVFSLARYPANLRDPAAPLNLIALGAMVACYLGLAGWALRRPGAGHVLGTLMGLAAAVAWSAEIWAGGPARLDRSMEQALGATFALLAVALTVAAGIAAGLRMRSSGVAVRAGLFAGLVSGVTVFCFAVVMTLMNLDVLATRDDYRHQFATSHSHPADIATFLVGDILTAGIAHLAINLVLGLIGAGLGAIVAALFNRTSIARRPATAR
jgi:hypothetical protein